MAVQPGVWGIDVGQYALKAVRLQMVNGQLAATAFDYVEHPKILNQSDADPDQLTREALEKFLSRNSIKGDVVAMSVPGQSGLARFVKLPPVEEKKITDIVRFEAKQQIPFNLNEVVWDYQKIGSGVVTDGFAMETEIGLFAIKRESVSRYLQHFKDVNIEVHIVQMTPLSLCNFVSYDLLGKGPAGSNGEAPSKKVCVVALDLGTDCSNLVITDGSRIIWQRPIPIGGNHFTRALTKDLHLTFAKAEHLKKNAMKSPDLKKILASLKPVLNDFVNEVQRSLGFFTNTHRDCNIQYLVGLGSAFRLPGLQKFLSEKLQVEVRKLSKFERLGGDSVVAAPVFADNVLSFPVAYGLALQGLKLPLLQTNLLPQDIQIERLIRSKKPWAVTAAAVLLAGLAFLTFGYSREHRAATAPVMAEARKEAKATLDTAADWCDKCDKKKLKIGELEFAVKGILAGQDERLNWVQFNKFLNDRLPRLDGVGLSDAQKNNYWLDPARDTVRGKLAYDMFKKNQAGLKGTDVIYSEEEIAADLVQVNLEAVNCMYSDRLEDVFTLGPFFTKLKAENKDPDGMRKDHAANPPQGPKIEIKIVPGQTRMTGEAKAGQRVLVWLTPGAQDTAALIADKKLANEGDPNLEGKVLAYDGRTLSLQQDARGWLVELRGYTYHKGSRQFVIDTLLANLAGDAPKPAPPKLPEGAPPAPAPVPPVGAEPVPAPKPVADKPKKDGEPNAIDGKISHAFLVNYQRVQHPDPAKFELITRSKLADLASGGIPQANRPNVALLPGEEAPPYLGPREDWKPLGGVGPQLRLRRGEEKRDDRKDDAPRTGLERTEFIIVFVWQEPTPSDSLMVEPPKAKPAAQPGMTTPPGIPPPPGGLPPIPPPPGGAIPPPPK